MFLSAIATLGNPTGDSPTPLPIIWDAPKIYRQATSVVTVAGLRVYIVPSPHHPDAVYTDGSKLGDTPTSGAAAVLRDSSVAVCRVSGAPNSYKAELIGILLGSHFGDHGDRLRLHCQEAILSSTGHKRPVRQAHWVQLVRASLRSKEQDLDWVEGHTGQQFNEASHQYAKLGTTPPPQRFALPPGISSGKVNTSCPPTKCGPMTLSLRTCMSISTRFHGAHRATGAWPGTSGSLESSPAQGSTTMQRSGEMRVRKPHVLHAAPATIVVCTECWRTAPPPAHWSLPGLMLGLFRFWLPRGEPQQCDGTSGWLLAWRYLAPCTATSPSIPVV